MSVDTTICFSEPPRQVGQELLLSLDGWRWGRCRHLSTWFIVRGLKASSWDCDARPSHSVIFVTGNGNLMQLRVGGGGGVETTSSLLEQTTAEEEQWHNWIKREEARLPRSSDRFSMKLSLTRWGADSSLCTCWGGRSGRRKWEKWPHFQHHFAFRTQPSMKEGQAAGGVGSAIQPAGRSLTHSGV